MTGSEIRKDMIPDKIAAITAELNNISVFIFPSPLYTHCYKLILFYIFRYFLTMEL